MTTGRTLLRPKCQKSRSYVLIKNDQTDENYISYFISAQTTPMWSPSGNANPRAVIHNSRPSMGCHAACWYYKRNDNNVVAVQLQPPHWMGYIVNVKNSKCLLCCTTNAASIFNRSHYDRLLSRWCRLSVCLSVCLSVLCIVAKQQNVWTSR